MKNTPAHPPLRPAQIQAVAALFRVLAEPTRLQILQFLHDGPRSVTDIVAGLDLKQANASKQLGILHDAGLLDRRREGNQVLYWIADPIIFDLCQLVCLKIRNDVKEQQRAFRP
jgi:DNA-binding transcriptional ArsR family regulator